MKPTAIVVVVILCGLLHECTIVHAGVTFTPTELQASEAARAVQLVLQRTDATVTQQLSYATADGTASSVGDPAGALSFHWFPVQHLETNGAEDCTAFSFQGAHYLAIANSRIRPYIYKHDGHQFRLHQELAPGTVRDWEAFQIDGKQYLAVANFRGPEPASFSTNSTVFLLNEDTGLFDAFQKIATNGAVSCKHFEHDGVHYLVYANYNDDRRATNINSAVYKWVSGRFQISQFIPTHGAFDIETFFIHSTPYIAIANNFDSESVSFEVESSIWAMDANGAFNLYESIATKAAVDWEAFVLEDGSVHLALANHRTNAGFADTSSHIYRWNNLSETFLLTQSFGSRGAYDWKHFAIEGVHFLALAMAGDSSSSFLQQSPIYQFNPDTGLFLYETAISTFGGRGLATIELAAGHTLLAVANFGGLAISNLTTHSVVYRLALTRPGVDYIPVTAGLVTFRVGELSQNVTIGIVNDMVPESEESFVVRHTDQGATAMATITIIDDDIDIFDTDAHDMTVLENQVSGTFVLPQIGFTMPSASTQLAFSIVDGSDLFVIDMRTGVVTTQTMLDREATPFVQFTVEAISSEHPGLSDTVVVTVKIDDLNDNDPVLVKSSLRQLVHEELPIGTIFGRVVAFDLDAGVNAELVYFFTVSNALFSIDAASGELSTKKVFDAESSDPRSYAMEVTVRDKGAEPRQVTGILQVVVLDINDNAPVIEKPIPIISVSEDRSVPSTVVTVVATDADEGLNALLTFSIVAGNQANRFGISSITGRITLIASLDYEETQQYTLTVLVQDSGSPRLEDMVNMTVQVLNVNDNGPVFAKKVYGVEISEATPIGSTVTTLTASDADGNDVDTRFSMEISKPFEINAITGVVTVTESLDRDSGTEKYLLLVVATDIDNNMSSTTTLEIRLLDENDNAPVFSTNVFVTTLPEDANNAMVVQLNATDKDSGLNAKLTYGIVSATPAGIDKYVIDPNTGIIVTKGRIFDRELTETYYLVVNVSDAGTPPLSAQASVNITILDVNDHAPAFVNSSDTIELWENSTTPVDVYTLVAYDGDATAAFNSMTFSIFSGNIGDVFVLEGSTLSLKESLDRETVDRYILVLQVSDGDFTDTMTLNIVVLDVNDNAPQGIPQANVTLPENSSNNTFVAQIQATDADSGINQMIVYSLLHPATGFNIDPVTGIIITARLFDYEVEADRVQHIVAKAADQGSPSLYITLEFYFFTSNVNDNAPVFAANTPSALTINEHAVGVVYTIEASDADAGDFGLVTFGLNNFHPSIGSEIFAIEAMTGVISIKNSSLLDREKVTTFTFTVVARDVDFNVSHVLAITLADINDHAPVFSPTTYSAEIKEESDVNTLVTTVQWTDGDATAIMRASTLTITSGNSEGLFSISPNGEVRTTGPFNASHTSFALTIVVANIEPGAGKTGVLQSNVMVLVKISPRNRNAPMFTQSIYAGFVLENATLGTLVLTVIATDEDEGLNGQIAYSIGGSTEGAFIILTNGSVMVAKPLDRETRDNYILTVYATDMGTPSLSTSAVVNITIGDSNDHPPVFSQASYRIRVNESLPAEYVFFTVQTTDGDIGENAVHQYQLFLDPTEEAAFPFTIGRFSGGISLKVGFDLDVDNGGPTKYEVVVVALSGMLTDSAMLTIFVDDVNDNAPVFPYLDNKLTVRVKENFPLSLPVVVLEASDADSGVYGQITFSIVDSDSEGVFEIDPISGSIMALLNLDFEERYMYTLKVKAIDGGGLSSTADVTIEVLDVNDNAPIFQNLPYVLYVEENSPPNTVVLTSAGGGILALDADEPNTGNSRVMYSFLDFQTSFAIDVNTGTITTMEVLDREAIAEYSLRVMAADQPSDPTQVLSNITTVIIRVLDLNDNAPFSPNTTASILENLSAGTVVVQLTASDADDGRSELRFELVEEHADFSVAPNGTVTTKVKLDRETVSSYLLWIRVHDDDFNPVSLNSTFTLNITVLDVNDNAPTFARSLFRVSILEEQPPMVLVINFGVTDADIGKNAEITYFIRSGAKGMFEIGRNNGILVAKTLDRESVANYTLVIEAKDGGSPSFSGTATVEVTVLDINDNSPVWVPFGGSVNLPENASIGTNVIHLQATDADLGENGTVVYELLTFSAKFAVDRTTGVMTTTDTFDAFDLKTDPATFNLTVQARDLGQPPRSTDLSFLVVLLYVSDRPPVFNEEVYVNSLDEHSPLGTFVIQVEAVSPDPKMIGRVSYAVLSHSQLFGVDSNGVVYVIGDIDRETMGDELLVTVQARDAASPPLVSSVLLYVFVNDINDNPPTFDGTFPMLIPLPEDYGLAQAIEIFTASDPDSSSQGKLRFSLQNDLGLFAIDAITGELTLKNALDFETEILHTLSVQVTDGQNFASATVVVVVQDINDNAPIFDMDFSLAPVYENATVGTQITRFSTTDADFLPANVDVNFAIVSGNIGGAFAINKLGELTVAQPLDRETYAEYNLTIRATDSGVPALSSEITILIALIDVNDNAPFFAMKQGELVGSLVENSEVGTVIMTVVASDPDLGDNARLSFSLVAGAVDDLRIHPVTGVVVSNRVFDYETKNVYWATVQVKDGAPPFFTAVVNITVEIIDANDLPPYFEHEQYTIDVRESHSLNEPLLILRYFDDDTLPEHKDSRFFLLSYEPATPANQFQVSAVTGQMRLGNTLDYESQKSYVIWVGVNNTNRPELGAKAKVTIVVIDINDNPPIFDFVGPLAVSFEENEVYTNILQISASDADAAYNTAMSYAIVGVLPPEAAINFAINSSTGIISVVVVLDREAMAQVELRVQATDNHHDPESLSSTVERINVTVLDQNDNAPYFEKHIYNVSIAENSLARTFLLSLEAFDRDEGFNAELTFDMIGNDSESFLLKFDNGQAVLYTNAPLDREQQARYEFTVVVKDRNGTDGYLEGNVTVVVVITDVNDNGPLFVEDVMYASVLEDVAVGTAVITVTATDADEGRNSEVVYIIVDGNTGDAFEINGTSGVISVKIALDYEAIIEYNLTVFAMDLPTFLGESPSTPIAVGKFHVAVVDVNDNDPVFTLSSFKFSILEEQPAGTYVGTVTATDADSGLNGQVTFTMGSAGGDEDRFRIDKAGDIFTEAVLDYEQQVLYTFSIIASDGGEPMRSTMTTVTVVLVDINDNHPVFEAFVSHVSINESASAGFVILQVKATDADSGDNGRVVYHLEPASGPFSIDRFSGQLTVKYNDLLDYETLTSYSLTIFASDLGSPPLSTFVGLTVYLIDENDNPPQFLYPGGDLLVLELTPVGDVLYIFETTDLDTLPENTAVEYVLILSEGDLAETFSISVDGNLSLSKSLNLTLNHKYVFTVRAVNGLLYTDLAVTIVVLDENDHSPLFVPLAEATILVREDIAVGTQIYQLQAKDHDRGRNAEVLFFTTVSWLKVDAHSGIVTLQEDVLDYEEDTTLFVSFIATDRATRPRMSTFRLIVEVDNVNDNAPEFIGAPYSVQMLEDASVNTTILIFNVTDADNLPNTQLLVYFIGENEDQKWWIDNKYPGGPALRLKKTVDRETQERYELLVQVSDGELTSDSKVIVQLQDVNDNAPLFAKQRFIRDIVENDLTYFEQFDVTDIDLPSTSGAIHFSIDPSAFSNKFEFVKGTGVLRLTSTLDAEVARKFEITLRASDTGPPSLSSTAVLEVHVGDVNDNVPQFSQTLYEASVYENVDVGTEVLQVFATDADFGENARLSFRFFRPQPAFAIDINTGSIATNRKLDRETLDQYDIIVVVTDGGGLKNFTDVYIRILDVNDNAPQFLQALYTQSIPENLNSQITVATTSASDPDLGLNGTAGITYSILAGPGSHHFAIPDPKSGTVVTTGPIDYEVFQVINITVQAKDGGKPPLMGTTLIVVTVIDLNDNHPQFNRVSYQFEIPEEASALQEVGLIVAVDADSGSFGEVTYSLDGPDSQYFAINTNTGLLIAQVTFDREEHDLYNFTVIAQDQGDGVNPGLANATTVVVIITDINDNVPQFSQTAYNHSFYEDLGVGKIAFDGILVSDADIGVNAVIRFLITQGNVGNAFSIDENTGVIYANQPLDRETTETYTLTVQASDLGIPSLSNWTVVMFTLLDVNDNAPQFLNEPYQVNISEAASVGDFIFRVTSFDPDLITSTTYTLAGQEYLPFAIHPVTGVIRLQATLDRESVASYVLKVTAADQDFLFNTTSIYVTVLDVNDNAPGFNPVPNVTRLIEEQPHIDFLILTAFDADEGLNGEDGLVFTGHHPLFDSGLFILRTTGPTSATLSTVGVDRETFANVTLYVTVTDELGHGLNTTIAVYIEFEDINDNAPQPTSWLFTGELPENSEPGYFGLTISATDADVGKNAMLFFNHDSQVPEEVRNAFTVEETTGRVISLKALDRELVASYTFNVTIRDGGDAPNMVTVQVHINILDENDNAPKFDQHWYAVQLSEDYPIETGFLTVFASDADIGLNAVLVFSIIQGNDESLFAIDADNGVLRLISSLDREHTAFFNLTLLVQDQGNPQLSGNATLYVTVLDVNDNVPTFPKDNVTIDVLEGLPVPQVMFTVIASDADLGENATLNFTFIKTEETLEHFKIDTWSGQIWLIRPLDRETTDLHILYVRVADQGIPSLSSVFELRVTVLDINDNSPVFDELVYEASVAENGPDGAELLTVSASDADIGVNAVIHFSIVSGNEEGAFSIDAVTGVITVDSLDFERTQAYTLGLLASNLYADPVLTASVFVHIVVLDVNDNEPEFSKEIFSLSVSEYKSPSTVLTRLVATDRDSGDNAKISYAFTGGNAAGLFQIDADDGTVRVAKPLDRETQEVHLLEVTATDAGIPSLSGSTILNITLLDENDNSPIFTQLVYHGDVAEDAVFGDVVLTVHATDADLGDNAVVKYTLLHDGEGTFIIDVDSGAIAVHGNLDYETQQAYVLFVKAKDMGIHPREAIAEVRISVQDVNDNAPIIISSNRVQIWENASVGESFHVMQTTDLDTLPVNTAVEYELLLGGNNGTFVINQSSGALFLMLPVDYEIRKEYRLTIRAFNHLASIPQSSTQQLVVQLLDVNDNAPVFSSDAYITNIREDLAVGQRVLSPSATDRDEGLNAQLIFSLEGGQWFSHFSINAATGAIILKESLDRNHRTEYHFRLIAADRGSPSLWTSVNVTIIVDDVNVFSPGGFSVTVPEDFPVDETFLVVVAQDLPFLKELNLRYAIVAGNSAENIRVDSASGNLSLASSLDYETKTEYALSVKAYGDGNLTAVTVVIITVLDINDNAPIFDEFLYEVAIYENVIGQTILTQVSATDKDSGQLGTAGLVYSIATGNYSSFFSVDPKFGTLRAVRPLDFEVVQEIRLIVVAMDGGTNPQLNGSALVVVTILDVNDNKPMFTQANYTVEVYEDTAVNTTIIDSILAVDADSGAFGTVTYSIAFGAANTFAINKHTGHVYLLQTLDFEQLHSYTLEVVASDGGNLHSTVNLFVIVLDVNDNAPRFDPLLDFAPSVYEDVPIGTVIFHARATDADSGQFGKVTYVLEYESVRGVFAVNASTGQVTNLVNFDREQLDTYVFDIQARDGGTNNRLHRRSDPEEAFTGAPVTSVPTTAVPCGNFRTRLQCEINAHCTWDDLMEPVCKDGISDVPCQILFDEEQCKSQAHRCFWLSPLCLDGPATTTTTASIAATTATSNAVTTEDATTEPILTEGVTMEPTMLEPPCPGLCTTVRVTLTILDVNDNQPRFIDLPYKVSIPEDTAVGVEFFKVRAVDADIGLNALLSFFAGQGNIKFAVNPQTGAVSVAAPLDRESTPVWFFDVIVRDFGVPTLGSATVIEITLLDVNDNSPIFVPVPVLNVREDQPINTKLTDVKAHDKDAGAFGTVTYRITKGNVDGKFSIDPNTGRLDLVGELDRETKDRYVLVILALDGGDPPRTALMEVTIIVLDVNDNAPVFGKTLYRMSVAENENQPVLLGQVTATDRDIGLAATIDFYVADGPYSSFFAIDRVLGTLVAIKPFDFEREQTVNITLEARDKGSPPLSAFVIVVVEIRDVNDNDPVFDHSHYMAEIPEDAEIGTTLLQVEATDADSGEFGRVTYSLFAGSLGHFSIEPNTGHIFTVSHINREEVSSYTLLIFARDQGGRTSTTTVFVSVLDRNDNAPTFDQEVYSAALAENLPVGVQVLRVTASDPDYGVNAQLRFRISEAQSGFTIDAVSGQIFSAASFDYEEQNTYVFTVLVSDQPLTEPVLTANVTVTVYITDVNDNDPQFMNVVEAGVEFASEEGSVVYTVTALAEPPGTTCDMPFEICTVGLTVLRVAATDADSPVNANLTFTLGAPSFLFALNSRSGVITTKTALDREKTAQHTLSVLVSDQGSPSRQVRAQVVINVADVNDNAPQFASHTPSEISVLENEAPGTLLHLFVGTDADAGINAQFSFHIAEGNSTGLFALEPSGRLTVAATLDYETEFIHNLVVEVVDRGSPSLQSTITVTVMVQDVNDMRPMFTQFLVEPLRVSSIVSVSNPLFFFTATDDDGTTVNSDLSYAISSVEPLSGAGVFAVDAHPAYGSVTQSGEPRLVSLQRNLADQVIEASTTYTLQLVASNPLSSTGPQTREIQQLIEVVPFVQLQKNLAQIQLNWQTPNPCATKTATISSAHCTQSRARRAAYTFEVWSRRNFNCQADKCVNKQVYPLSPDICECLVYGPGVPGYDGGKENLMFPVVTGTSYEFQLRQLEDGVTIHQSKFVSYKAPSFGILNVRTTPSDVSDGAITVTWDNPVTRNGVFVTYKVCYCSTLLVLQVDCTCAHAKAVEHSVTDVSDTSTSPRKEIPVPAGGRFWFVVELITSLDDGTLVVTRSDAVLQTQLQASTSSASLGSGGAAGTAIAGVILLALLVLLAVLLARHRRQRGRVQPHYRGKAAPEDGTVLDSVAIGLLPLQKKIFADSQEHVDDINASSTDHEPGYWDYFSEERAQLFWPESNEQRPTYDEISFTKQQETSFSNRSFGLNAPHVFGDNIADTLMPRSMNRSASFVSEKTHGGPNTLGAAFSGNLRTTSTIDLCNVPKLTVTRKADGTMENEFATIKQSAATMGGTHKAATETYNVRKNRYANVLPADETRVKLSHSGILGSDYINASFVDGWQHTQRYIATQGPIPGTIHDFWRMIWEQNSSVIVMVTREVEQGKLKCHKYWPDEGGAIQCGTLEVIFQAVDETNPEFTTRRLLLQNTSQHTSREITQYVYSHWPDQGVPVRELTSVINTLQEVRRTAEANTIQLGLAGPIVIHCSAGIGRTGTFAAIDICMQRLDAIGSIDIPITVANIRSQRPGSVQTLVQYRFIYEAVCSYANQLLCTNPRRQPALGTSQVASAAADTAAEAQLSHAEQQQLELLAGADNGMSIQELLAALEEI